MKTKKKDVLNRFLPLWAIPPLVTILAVNCLIYWGSSALTASRYHYDFTMAFDRAVPLLPGFVWIYILAFPFWAAGYMLAARRGKDMFYRFVATDLTIHLICFLIFILVPTTNIRPEIAGDTISQKVLLLVYALDGGSAPSNLFPVYSLLCKLDVLERCGRVFGYSKMVSEIFPGVCGSGYYIHTGSETALYCGCGSGSGAGRVFLEILPERAAA